MRVLGINGILSDGSTSTDLFIAKLKEAGHNVVDFNYGKVNVVSARWKQHKVGKQIFDKHIPSNDCVVAHSFGCLAVFRAMQQGAKFKKVFLFAPAMNHKVTFPYHAAEQIYVIYHPQDMAIWAGANLLLNHPFGRMGRKGYSGPEDSRVFSIEAPLDGNDWLKHSTFFEPHTLDWWAAFVHDLLPEPAG